jgi:hypothetical protein
MTKNMGTADRVIRVLVVIAIAGLYFAHRISGTLALVLGIIAAMFLISSLIGWCPGYAPFKFSTRGKGTPGSAGA